MLSASLNKTFPSLLPLDHVVDKGLVVVQIKVQNSLVKKERNALFNDTLNTFH